MNDYTWPSVYFAYFFFTISLGLALYFFIRSWRDGYWGKDAEEVKFTVFDEDSPVHMDRDATADSAQTAVSGASGLVATRKGPQTQVSAPHV